MHAEWCPAIGWALPFAGLLFSIALLPVLASGFWHKLKNQAFVSLGFAVPILFLYLSRSPHALLVTLEHYVSFIVLLGALFVVSGGIWISGSLKSTSFSNSLLLALGAVLSNVIGTTGASMVLIRPLLFANRHRKHHWHLPVFFIVLVSNVGGLLTPLGDPPLFLGFLQGVPFFWTLKLFPIWLFAVGSLLILFYIVDSISSKGEAPPTSSSEAVTLKGKRNLLCLTAIVAAVFLPFPYREIVMVISALVSFKATPKKYHEANEFKFYPIFEVAILFLGIFITMLPAIQNLRLHGAELGIGKPWQFLWLTGGFSSVLDNAPTYLTLVALAQGLGSSGPHLGIPESLLRAISVGAVFFGACTYIGNAPNFMVRTIAAHSGWRMPSFFGYMARVAIFLIPLFLIITFLFFR